MLELIAAAYLLAAPVDSAGPKYEADHITLPIMFVLDSKVVENFGGIDEAKNNLTEIVADINSNLRQHSFPAFGIQLDYLGIKDILNFSSEGKLNASFVLDTLKAKYGSSALLSYVTFNDLCKGDSGLYLKGGEDILGMAEHDGSNSVVKLYGDEKLAELIEHEVLHNLGSDHNNRKPNIMKDEGFGYKKLTWKNAVQVNKALTKRFPEAVKHFPKARQYIQP
jgi:hypothetical protein